MQLTTIRSEGLAHLSYFLASEHEAIVIDPRRDVDVYMKMWECRVKASKVGQGMAAL